MKCNFFHSFNSIYQKCCHANRETVVLQLVNSFCKPYLLGARKMADLKLADLKMADLKLADLKMADLKMTDQIVRKMADLKLADLKMADQKNDRCVSIDQRVIT